VAIRPDVICLVPERPEELTTSGGLDVVAGRKALGPHVKALAKAGIRVCVFVDPELRQISAAADLGIPQIELHTGLYAKAAKPEARKKALDDVKRAAAWGVKRGLEVTAGHDIDYRNAGPIVAIPQITELSIGFSIVARAAIVGVSQAVREMVLLLK
jgi:pyridoxine 5-phosphate synthase